jgi:hypothetical protein
MLLLPKIFTLGKGKIFERESALYRFRGMQPVDCNTILLFTLSEIAVIGPESIKRRQVLQYPSLGAVRLLTLQVG